MVNGKVIIRKKSYGNNHTNHKEHTEKRQIVFFILFILYYLLNMYYILDVTMTYKKNKFNKPHH